MLTLNTLNEAQRSAVTAGKVPLLILAGPGSGKTTVVLQRIFYLLEVLKVPPEKILALTFTKEAASSMAKRFADQSINTIPVYFGTFHSCFYQILRNSGYYRSYSLLDQNFKYQMIKEAFRKNYPYDSNKDFTEFLDCISYYKNTKDWEKTQIRLPEKNRLKFGPIYRTYENLRKTYKKLDFDDMVLECLDLLRNDALLRNKFRAQFEFLLLDEFQDINPMQYETLKLLTPTDSPIFAVGDDDQGIYGFRGASTRCLKRFEEEYHANKIILDQNYRSCEGIVKSAEKVISGNKDRYVKHQKALSKVGNGLQIHPFAKEEEQLQFIHRFYEKKEGETYCILFRTNLLMQRYAIRFTRDGIPYSMKGNGQSIYNHFVAKDLFGYLEWINGKEDRNLFFAFMNKPFRGIFRENVDKDPKAARLMKELRSLRGKPLFLQLQYLLHRLQYNVYLMKKAGENVRQLEEWSLVRDILMEDAGKFPSFEHWKSGMKDFTEVKKSELMLMTAHASKGLEFDHVWIPDCNEGVFPHQLLPDVETCGEERRIFYVAMTRAKKSLDLSYLSEDKNRSRAPSRFLSGL